MKLYLGVWDCVVPALGVGTNLGLITGNCIGVRCLKEPTCHHSTDKILVGVDMCGLALGLRVRPGGAILTGKVLGLVVGVVPITLRHLGARPTINPGGLIERERNVKKILPTFLRAIKLLDHI